jgi:hypothetical protein
VWINPAVRKPTAQGAPGSTIVTDNLRADRIPEALTIPRSHDDRRRSDSNHFDLGVSMFLVSFRLT